MYKTGGYDASRNVSAARVSAMIWPASETTTRPALGSIKARAVIMPGQYDTYFPPVDSEYEASKIPNAECRVIPSIWGHRAGSPGSDPVDIAFLDQAIRDLLAH